MTSDQRRTANRHPEIAADIRRIIRKYSMRQPGGAVLCQPRDVELCLHPLPGRPEWSGHNGKVCFGTHTAAALAAEEIGCLPGADPVAVYPCPRGGHFHHVAEARRRRTIAEIVERIADAARRAGQ